MNTMERLSKVFKKYSKNNTLTVESSLKDLGLDSLDLVEVIMDIEEEFDIQFEDDEMLSLKTVADVLSTIESKIK